jgi:hypothetical protein
LGDVEWEVVRAKKERRPRVGRRSILVGSACCDGQIYIYVESGCILVIPGYLAEEIRERAMIENLALKEGTIWLFPFAEYSHATCIPSIQIGGCDSKRLQQEAAAGETWRYLTSSLCILSTRRVSGSVCRSVILRDKVIIP